MGDARVARLKLARASSGSKFAVVLNLLALLAVAILLRQHPIIVFAPYGFTALL